MIKGYLGNGELRVFHKQTIEEERASEKENNWRKGQRTWCENSARGSEIQNRCSICGAVPD
jgi:hypothetical protein